MAKASMLDGNNSDTRGLEMWRTMEARQGRSGVFAEIGDVVVLMTLPRMSLVNGQNLFIDG